MGQRYIEALGKQAKPENMFLVRSSVDSVQHQVNKAVNLLDLNEGIDASAEEMAQVEANREEMSKKISWKDSLGISSIPKPEPKVQATESSRAERLEDITAGKE